MDTPGAKLESHAVTTGNSWAITWRCDGGLTQSFEHPLYVPICCDPDSFADPSPLFSIRDNFDGQPSH
jgi:hypothetical protein